MCYGNEKPFSKSNGYLTIDVDLLGAKLGDVAAMVAKSQLRS
jgi:hypothetical protein